MLLILKALLPAILLAWAASNAPARTLRIENPFGGVSVEVTSAGRLQIEANSPSRPVVAADISSSDQPALFLIKVNPADGARIDLDIKLPYGAALQVRTTAGPIWAKGLFAAAELATETGELEIETPWDASRFRLIAREKPKTVDLPRGFRFDTYVTAPERGRSWVLEDRLPEMRVTYGQLLVDAGHTPRVTLKHMPVPRDSPVKLPWQAPAALDAILAGEKRATNTPPQTPPSSKPPPQGNAGAALAPGTELEPGEALAPDGEALFTSSVRMVSLNAAVYDEKGRPITGLQAQDFAIVENGVPQEIAFASTEETPFNLILLLDLSGSTKQDREDMKTAALRFLDIARPNDRVGVYALANNRFHVVSPLTNDREQLRHLIPALPEVSGGTPLYDALVLSYAEELIHHEGERNALIVISDGVDNQLYGSLTPSDVSFDKLRKAARQFDALIYPILLNAAEEGSRTTGWSRKARQRMEELAADTGGRLFPARSLQQLDPVYPQVESELRAVYALAYYPKDQKLDGTWHAVDIQVKRPRANVRSRQGYIADP
jgi:VWFA-related protein